VAGLAVPVWSKNRQAVAGSLAIAGPIQRLDEAAVPRLLDALYAAQHAIKGGIGLLR
jgi:IclR family transcriptional regulator, acetate operon repressor